MPGGCKYNIKEKLALHLTINFVLPSSSILRGLVTQKGERSDRFISNAVTERLFMSKEMEEYHAKAKHKVELSDLASRNIQRGRDHGLPFYHSYRSWANLSDITQIDVQPCVSCCRWVV